jgi:nitrate/nitrite-specific signal transduction histidine kinase
MMDHRNVRVLIAEDDRPVSQMVRITLEEELGYDVVGEATSGFQAIEMARRVRPDVILMDIKMPDMDGIEAIPQILASCPTPVVILTAYDAPELVRRASAAGAGAYLVKPPDAREMERAITIAMARFDDIMELRHLNLKLQQHDEVQKKATQLGLIAKVTQKITHILDLDELLPQVVRMISDTFGYHSANVALVERDREELVLKACSDPLGARFKVGQQGVISRAARSGEPVLVNDARSGPGRHFARMRQSELAVPIKVKGELTGVLAVQSIESNALGEDDVFVLQTLADQISIAIENARSHQQTDKELQARVKELSALYAISQTMNYSLDLDSVLQLVLDRVVKVVGMDAGGVLLLNPLTDEVTLRACRDWSPELVQVAGRSAVDEGLMPRMLESVLVVDDPSQLTKAHHVIIEEEGFQSIVSVPIKIAERTLGVIGLLGHEPRTFAPEELELLATIGNQVGVAIDRANLQAQELKVAILEERQAMAWQLHDDIAQTLGYLGLQVDGVMNSASLAQNVGVQTALEELRRDIEDTYERVRSSIIRLQGDMPDHFDLGAALQKSGSEFEAQTGCMVEFKIDRERLPRLTVASALQATFIVHEALTNVQKHSGADTVRLVCRGLEDDTIEIIIQDNGQGFDPDDERRSNWDGFGLRFMRERAARVGGSLGINSQPGQGVQVAIRLPSG